MATNGWFDFRFTQLMDSANWILILALIIFGFALFWLLKTQLIAQLLLLFAFFAVEERWANPFFWLVLVLQVALSAWTVGWIVQEIESSNSQRSKRS